VGVEAGDDGDPLAPAFFALHARVLIGGSAKPALRIARARAPIERFLAGGAGDRSFEGCAVEKAQGCCAFG